MKALVCVELEHQGAWSHSPPEPCSALVFHAALALLPVILLFMGALPGLKTAGGKPGPWRLVRTGGF